MKRLLVISAASISIMTAGAAAQAPANAPAAVCTTCGVVTSIRYVEQKGQGTGAGAVVGGVVGGIVGHQFGSGRGNTAATIAGVGVGAYAGNEVEKNKNKKFYYEINVKLDNGNRRSFTQGSNPPFHEGDRVKIVDGNRLALLAK
jgi:outer membrane lipoprotein SlyB